MGEKLPGKELLTSAAWKRGIYLPFERKERDSQPTRKEEDFQVEKKKVSQGLTRKPFSHLVTKKEGFEISTGEGHY